MSRKWCQLKEIKHQKLTHLHWMRQKILKRTLGSYEFLELISLILTK